MIAAHNCSQKVALPSFFYGASLFHLDDATSPIGEAIGNVDILNDSWLQSLTQLKYGSLPHGGVDIAIIQHMDAKRKEDGFRLRLTHRDPCHMKCRGLVGLPHISRPFGMEPSFALFSHLFRLGSFESAILRS